MFDLPRPRDLALACLLGGVALTATATGHAQTSGVPAQLIGTWERMSTEDYPHWYRQVLTFRPDSTIRVMYESQDGADSMVTVIGRRWAQRSGDTLSFTSRWRDSDGTWHDEVRAHGVYTVNGQQLEVLDDGDSRHTYTRVTIPIGPARNHLATLPVPAGAPVYIGRWRWKSGTQVMMYGRNSNLVGETLIVRPDSTYVAISEWKTAEGDTLPSTHKQMWMVTGDTLRTMGRDMLTWNLKTFPGHKLVVQGDQLSLFDWQHLDTPVAVYVREAPR